ncbi:hypothetical protein LTR67_008433 [Exophiala xenobiotica]
MARLGKQVESPSEKKPEFHLAADDSPMYSAQLLLVAVHYATPRGNEYIRVAVILRPTMCTVLPDR